MESEYVISEGSKRISELQVQTELGDDDLMVFSNVKIQRYGSTNRSVKIRLGDLFNIVNDKFKECLNPGTMAYEDKDDYAKAIHSHDFSDVKLTNFTFENQQKIGTAFVKRDSGTISKDIFVPVYEQLQEPQAYIGELKILACQYKTREEIINSITNGTFDGWVYPDGTTFSKTMGAYDFTEAWELFCNNGSASETVYFTTKERENIVTEENDKLIFFRGISEWQFTVPDFRNFLKIKGSGNTSISLVPFQVGLKQHFHSASGKKITVQNGIVADIYCDVTQGNGELTSNALHRGSDNKGSVTDNNHISADEKQTITLKSVSGKQTTRAGNEDESYPTHNVVPCMIYIGNKINED